MGKPDHARDLYMKLAATVPAQSYSAHGLADVAMYEGKLKEAAGILDAGIRADEQNSAMWRWRNAAWVAPESRN